MLFRSEKFNPAGGTILMLWDGSQAVELGQAWTGSGGSFGPHPAILTENGLVLWESSGILKLWDGHRVRTFWNGWLVDMVGRGMFVDTKLGGSSLGVVWWGKWRERTLWNGTAFDLNNRGQVAGTSANGTAMFWDGRQAIELWRGDARQLNDKGQVAGNEGEGGHAKAVLWTPEPTGPPDWRLMKPRV